MPGWFRRRRRDGERELFARAGDVLGVDLLADAGVTWDEIAGGDSDAAFVELVLAAFRKHRNEVLARVFGEERWSRFLEEFPGEDGGERDFVAELDEGYLRSVLPIWRDYGCTPVFLQNALAGHIDYQMTAREGAPFAEPALAGDAPADVDAVAREAWINLEFHAEQQRLGNARELRPRRQSDGSLFVPVEMMDDGKTQHWKAVHPGEPEFEGWLPVVEEHERLARPEPGPGGV